MSVSQQLAKHFKELHFGGNWTAVNLKDVLEDVDWQEATTQVPKFNSIAVLVFHIHYYISATLKAMENGVLDAHDDYSFDMPTISSKDDWARLLQNLWTDAEGFTKKIRELEDSQLSETFIDPKYGSYFRNINGIIEHSHYHLGQIVILKRLIKEH